jgi:hypothetical protein
MANKTQAPLDNAKVKLAESDVKIIKIALDYLWEGYNLEGENGVYTIKNYDVFKREITEIIDEEMGGMSVELPSGKNFASFSFRGDKKSFHVVVEAKDKKGTMIHGTREKTWRE